jgi:hypothetical protein
MSIEKAPGIPSEINVFGREVLEIVAECKRNAKYNFPGNVYERLCDPIIPDFGDLNDLETPCKLVINDFYTPDTSIDDYNETCKDILYFDKKMVVSALSQLEPEKTVTVKGTGLAVHFYEKGGFEFRTERDKEKSDIKNKVEVTMTVTYFRNGKQVMFNFDSMPVEAKNKFRLTRSVSIGNNLSLSSDLLV